MKKKLPLLFSLFIMGSVSCNRHYYPSVTEQKIFSHKVVAILPVEMIYTGTQPKNIREEDINKMEEEESKTFQQFLHDNILRNGNTAEYTLTVSVQNYINTIALLDDNKISIHESWYKTDDTLCKLLKVDAIVRMKVQKKRFMSDAASMGIDYGRRIIGAVFNKNVYAPNKTNDILATCSLISKGETLWNDNFRETAYWNSPADYIINDITRNFAYHIPYRHRR